MNPTTHTDGSPVMLAGATCAAVDGACRDFVTEGLGLRYGSSWAFSGLSLRFPACRISAVVGPSGCGKSSLLTTLNRLDELEPTARLCGRVCWGGLDIRRPDVDVISLRRRIGMLFQRPTPFPLSIRKNLELPLREHGCRSARERSDRAEQALRSVGLWAEVVDRLDAPAVSLSGGQQQRLCLARILALQPEILLMDEPCSSLDPLSAEIIEDLIASLRGFYTVILVTHDLGQARRLADHICVLWPGLDGGTLAATGSPDAVFASCQVDDPVLARYLGHGGNSLRSIAADSALQNPWQ